MKTLFKPLIVLFCAAVAFSSCMKDTSAEDEAERRRQEEAYEALLLEQKTKIDAYVAAHPSEVPGGWQADDREEQLPSLGKSVKTGIRFEVLAVPTEEDDKAYEYEFSASTGIVSPKVKVNYTAYLLDGTEVQSGENENIDFATFQSTSNIYTPVWTISFFPKSYRVNGEDRKYYGLTAKGLKKGSHIRVVSPSVWAYGSSSKDKIPANSPLVYEFEVLSIE